MALEGTLAVSTTDDVVTFELIVTNTGSEPVTLNFSSGAKADFSVIDEGTEIWRFSDGRMFTQVLSEDRIEPAEDVVYDGEWREPVAGTYTAVGELQARETTVDAETEFTVSATHR